MTGPDRKPPRASKTAQTASEIVRDAIQRSGLPLRELARRTGVEPAVLSRFVNGQVGLSLSTFEKLAPELGLRVAQVRKSRADAKGRG